VLSDRYVQAESMASETQVYYTNLTDTISADDVHQWEKEILDAERRRLDHPPAMDILRAQDVHMGPDPHPGAGPDTSNPAAGSPGEKWIQLGMVIEERQYVLMHTFIYFVSQVQIGCSGSCAETCKGASGRRPNRGRRATAGDHSRVPGSFRLAGHCHRITATSTPG
jgi:hypothetical protein